MLSPIEKKMANCPRCQKPILNEGIFTASVKFNMRCPWCQSTLEINVQPKIVTEVIKLANGDKMREVYENGHKIEPEAQKTEYASPSGQLPLSNNPLNAKDINQPVMVASPVYSPSHHTDSELNKRAFRIEGHFYPEEEKSNR